MLAEGPGGPLAAPLQIFVAQNWFDELRRLAPTPR
jgi:hypothetical protein